MKHSEMKKFFSWVRNGTCFAFTWLMILVEADLLARGQAAISAAYIGKLLILCLGGSLLFSFCFTKAFLRTPGFTRRLLLFFLSYGIYQSLGFWWLGIVFTQLSDWLIYIGILLLCWGICQLGYGYYSKKVGALYTEALNRYKAGKREDPYECTN